VPKDSQLIILESEGKAAQEPNHRQVQAQVVAALINDHSRMFNLLRSGIELEKQQALRGLDELKDSERFLLTDLKRLDLSGDLLRQQIEDANSLIEAAVKSRAQAIREANDEARTMTLLMRDNEFQQHRTRLAGLEQRFQIGLAQRRDDLNNTPCDKKLHDNKREQSVQGAVLQRLGLRMQNLLEPRAVATDLKSRDPVGLPAAIAAPGILLGGLLSLLVAFGLEFRDQLRIWRERRNSPAFALHWNLRRPPVCRGPC